MKITFLTTLSIFAIASQPAIAADTYEIDSSKSKVTFKIQNKPPGAKDFTEVDGKFTDFSGTVVFDDANPSNSSVEMT